MKNNQLFNGTLIFFVFIIGALLFSGITHKAKGYAKSNEDVMKEIQEEEISISLYDFLMLMADSSASFQLIDLRDETKYALSHFDNAINIPLTKITENSALKQLNNNQLKILYSNYQNEAALACLMLSSLGIENIKIVPGSFDIVNSKIINTPEPSYYFYNDVKAQWDYNRQMGGTSVKATQAPPVIPQQIDMKPPVKGGC